MRTVFFDRETRAKVKDYPNHEELFIPMKDSDIIVGDVAYHVNSITVDNDSCVLLVELTRVSDELQEKILGRRDPLAA